MYVNNVYETAQWQHTSLPGREVLSNLTTGQTRTLFHDILVNSLQINIQFMYILVYMYVQGVRAAQIGWCLQLNDKNPFKEKSKRTPPINRDPALESCIEVIEEETYM